MKRRIDEFVMRYVGQKVDFDKVYGAQCVDLFRQYCYEVLELPHTGSVEGAKDLWLNYDILPLEKLYFDKITKGPTTGDVVVYGPTRTNKYGHVAIVLGNMPGRDLLLFEQDGFKQDGAKIVVRDVDNLLGYLRRKTV